MKRDRVTKERLYSENRKKGRPLRIMTGTGQIKRTRNGKMTEKSRKHSEAPNMAAISEMETKRTQRLN
jgi:hypothetical protein